MWYSHDTMSWPRARNALRSRTLPQSGPSWMRRLRKEGRVIAEHKRQLWKPVHGSTHYTISSTFASIFLQLFSVLTHVPEMAKTRTQCENTSTKKGKKHASVRSGWIWNITRMRVYPFSSVTPAIRERRRAFECPMPRYSTISGCTNQQPKMWSRIIEPWKATYRYFKIQVAMYICALRTCAR
jgi:hypothetical protein